MTHPTATATPAPSTLHRRVWAAGSADVVICLHGMESHGDWFDEFAVSLNRRHLDVAAYDRAGFGRSPGAAGDAMSIDALLAELDGIRASMSKYKRIHLAGLSWGGLLALRAASDRPAAFSSVSLIAPALIYKRRLPPPAALMALLSFFSGGRVKVSLPIRPEDFTARPDRLAFIDTDAHRTKAVTGRFLFLTLLLQRQTRQRLERGAPLPPVQMLLAGVEPLVDNPAMKKLIQGTGVTVREWPACRHSLVFEAPDEIAAAVADLARTGGAP